MKKIWLQLEPYYLKYKIQIFIAFGIIVALILFFLLTDTTKNEIKVEQLEVDKTEIKDRIKKIEDSLAEVNKPILDSYVAYIKQQDAQIRVLKQQRETYYFNWKVAEGKIKRMTVSDMQKRFDSLYPGYK